MWVNARLRGVYREARTSWKNAQNKPQIVGEPPDTFTTSKRGKKTSLNIDYSGEGRGTVYKNKKITGENLL